MSAIQILSTKILSENQKQALESANFNVIEADFIQIKNQKFIFITYLVNKIGNKMLGFN